MIFRIDQIQLMAEIKWTVNERYFSRHTIHFFFLKTEWPINMTRCNTTSTASVYADLRRFFLVLCQHINCFQYHSYSLISILFNNKILCMNSVISHKAFYDLFFQITFLLLNHIFLKVLIWRVVVVIFPIVFVWKYISN